MKLWILFFGLVSGLVLNGGEQKEKAACCNLETWRKAEKCCEKTSRAFRALSIFSLVGNLNYAFREQDLPYRGSDFRAVSAAGVVCRICALGCSYQIQKIVAQKKME